MGDCLLKTLTPLTTKRVTKVTHALAKEWANMPTLNQDRVPQGTARLAMLKGKLKTGHFHSAIWVKVFIKELGKHVRQDGGTTSTAFDEVFEEGFDPYAQGFTLTPEVILKEYEVDTVDEAVTFFNQFNHPLSSRKQADANRVIQCLCPELMHIKPTALGTIVSGLAYEKWGEGYSKTILYGEPKARLLLDNVEFSKWCNTVINSRDGRWCNRMPAVAAMKRIWDFNQEDCLEFWGLVCSGRGSNPHGGDRRLGIILQKHASQEGRKGSTRSSVIARRDLFVLCIKGYNSWAEGGSKDYEKGRRDNVPDLTKRQVNKSIQKMGE